MSKMQIPLGPQHPALKEPENFMLVLDGEQIVDATVNLGYNHRGIEKAAENRNYIQDIYLIERVCGICSHSHVSCYIGAVEEIAKVEVPARAKALRTIVAELERIHSHLLWLGVAAFELGYDTLFMYTWRDREQVLDCLELLSGNRVHYGMNTIGGVRRDITKEQVDEISKKIKYLKERTSYYVNVVTEEPTFLARTQNVGKLPKDVALEMNAVGPTARASGVDIDVRRDEPYFIYDQLDWKVITYHTCDVFGRAVVRVLETIESYKMIEQILKAIPEGPISVKVPWKIPAGEAVFRYEAPRGEDIHYVKSNGTEYPERVKVRAPTLSNFQSLPYCLKQGYLADAVITIAAIDPCMSCTDRAVVYDIKKGERKTFDQEELRKYSIEFYKKKGISFK
jgi:NADH-quinone oxidoreductase subunit D